MSDGVQGYIFSPYGFLAEDIWEEGWRPWKERWAQEKVENLPVVAYGGVVKHVAAFAISRMEQEDFYGRPIRNNLC